MRGHDRRGAQCWGNNNDGRLGDGTTTGRAAPVLVLGSSTGITAISAGSRHTCAVNATGGAKCWGNNSNGRLGVGLPGTSYRSPVDVAE